MVEQLRRNPDNLPQGPENSQDKARKSADTPNLIDTKEISEAIGNVAESSENAEPVLRKWEMLVNQLVIRLKKIGMEDLLPEILVQLLQQ